MSSFRWRNRHPASAEARSHGRWMTDRAISFESASASNGSPVERPTDRLISSHRHHHRARERADELSDRGFEAFPEFSRWSVGRRSMSMTPSLSPSSRFPFLKPSTSTAPFRSSAGRRPLSLSLSLSLLPSHQSTSPFRPSPKNIVFKEGGGDRRGHSAPPPESLSPPSFLPSCLRSP